MSEQKRDGDDGPRYLRGQDCECKTWCTDDYGLDSVLGHHHRCPHAPDPVAALRRLVRELTDGMDVWAQDCGGVHPAAWDAYRRAKLLGGVFVDDQEAP